MEERTYAVRSYFLRAVDNYALGMRKMGLMGNAYALGY